MKKVYGIWNFAPRLIENPLFLFQASCVLLRSCLVGAARTRKLTDSFVESRLMDQEDPNLQRASEEYKAWTEQLGLETTKEFSEQA